MIAGKENITDLIPQRSPFVMIDSLLYADDEKAISSFEVQSANLLLKNGTLSASALIENIAQTAAAHAGYKFRQNNEPVKLGFIGAVDNVVVQELPVAGAKLKTEIEVINNVFNVTIIRGKVTSGEQELMQCKMKIFMQ